MAAVHIGAANPVSLQPLLDHHSSECLKMQERTQSASPPLSCASVVGCVQHVASPFLLLHLLLAGWMVCTIWNVSLHLFTVFQTQVSFCLTTDVCCGVLWCVLWCAVMCTVRVFSPPADVQPVQFPVVAVYSGEADRTLAAALTSGAPALLRVGGVRDGE